MNESNEYITIKLNSRQGLKYVSLQQLLLVPCGGMKHFPLIHYRAVCIFWSFVNTGYMPGSLKIDMCSLLMYTRITIYGLVKKSVMPLFIFWITFLLDLELYRQTTSIPMGRAPCVAFFGWRCQPAYLKWGIHISTY